MLDCSSVDSTLGTLSGILKVPSEEIVGALLSIDLERLAGEHSQIMAADEALAEVVCQKLKVCRDDIRFGRIAYFHLTRTWPDQGFTEGILPLGHVIDKVWQKLESTICPPIEVEVLRELRQRGPRTPGDHWWGHYAMKSSGRMHWGPYGVLIREVAFEPQDVGNHDYLAIPEIIEDICRSLHGDTGIDVLPLLERALHPGIVKFYADEPSGDPLPPCLCYLYYRLHQQPLSLLCNNIFDGRGTPVSPGRILGVEWL